MQEGEAGVGKQEIPEANLVVLAAEVASMTDIVLAAKISTVKKETEGKTPGELSEDQKVILGLYILQTAKSLDLSKGTPIVVTLADEQRWKVVGITKEGEDDHHVICRVESKDGSTRRNETVLRQQLLQGQLVAEKDKVLSTLSGGQKALIEQYIGLVEDGKLKDAEVARKALVETASEMGWLTIEDFREAVKALYPEKWLEPKEGGELKPEPEAAKEGEEAKTQTSTEKRVDANAAEREEQLKMLDSVFGDRVIVNEEILLRLCQQLGVGSVFEEQLGSIKGKIETLQEQIQELEKSVGSTVYERDAAGQVIGAREIKEEDIASQRRALETQIAVFKRELGVYETYAEMFSGENGPLARYFEQLKNGEISTEQARQIVEEVRKGNIDALFNQFVEEATRQAEAEGKSEAEKRQRREQMRERMENLKKSALKVGGMASIVIVLFLLAGLMQGVGGGQH